jgi:phenylalanyl-tRNA synthetase alpha chain
MKQQLERIKVTAENEMAGIQSVSELDSIRVKYMGKKGELTSVLRGMNILSKEERPIIGQLANEVRNYLEEKIEDTKKKLLDKEKIERMKKEVIDVTMPGRRRNIGKRHPLTIVLDEVKDIFLGLGFSIAEGPEIERDYYNFEALNIPKNHPARDEQDTFYIDDSVVLRTQTSPVQIRVMEKTKPPIRIISPGRVYRADTVDATHSPIFNQIEGLAVDKNITMGDLKGTLEIFLKKLFGDEIKVRFRPHHFQFTEPSAEVDVSCFICKGSGCRVCKGEGWIEIMGAGMVHPKVLANCDIDPKEYSGFAFGMGLERIVMTRFEINDLRLFYENDIRFLNQF